MGMSKPNTGLGMAALFAISQTTCSSEMHDRSLPTEADFVPVELRADLDSHRQQLFAQVAMDVRREVEANCQLLFDAQALRCDATHEDSGTSVPPVMVWVDPAHEVLIQVEGSDPQHASDLGGVRKTATHIIDHFNQ